LNYQKQIWTNLPSETTPLSADRLNHLETQFDAAKALIDALPGVQAADFGVVADGTTDNTDAVRQAVAAVAATGGGTLEFPPGVIRVDGLIKIPSNIHITGPGATITKTGSGSGFTSVLFAALGGSGWCRNVIISDISFKGNFPSNGINVLWAHKLAGLTVRNVTVTDSTTGGHVLDLQGCTDTVVEQNVFSGAFAMTGREYSECIQIDASVRNGSPLPDEPGQIYDGTPTQRLLIRRNRFLSQGIYAAPRAVGAHTAVQSRYYTDIEFSYNYLETPLESTSWRGVINFLASKRVLVKGNDFNISPGLGFLALVIFHETSTWVATSAVNTANAPYVPASDKMLGDKLSSLGNTRVAGYPATSRDYLAPRYATGFKSYGATDVFLLWNDGFVTLVGEFGKVNTTDPSGGSGSQIDISTATEVTVGYLPDEYTPKRTLRLAAIGSGTETFMLSVKDTGEIAVSRYSSATRTNPYLAVYATWPAP